MEPKTFIKKEILASSWELYKKYALVLILAFFVPTLIVGLVSYASTYYGWNVPSILFTLLNTCISMASMMVTLSMVRGTYTTFKKAFQETISNITLLQILIYIIASVLYILMTFGGMFLLVVPGVILSLTFMFFGYAILDDNLGIFKSLGRSNTLTKGHRWNLFLMGLIMVLLIGVSIIPFGLGLFITVPLSSLVLASTYDFLKKAQATTTA